MKIFLINPIIRPESPPAYFPLGLGYVANVLQADGHQVRVLDINAHRWLPQEVEERIHSSIFDLVGISGLITEYRQIEWLSKLLKEHHRCCPIVLGGGLASSMPEIVLDRAGIDVAVIGEGEDTIRELVAAFERNGELGRVEGIAFKQNGKTVITNPRPPIFNLDTLPFPAYNLFSPELYAHGEKLAFDFPARSLNIITSRGCPYRCVYCEHSIFGYAFRQRSAANVIAEMRFLKREFDIDGIVFSDDTFILNKKWVHEFCETLIQERPPIPWVCNGRVNLIDRELVLKMREAGCQAIFFGIESGSQRILDAMQKKVTVKQAEQAVEICRKAGLQVGAYFMIGMMGETPETVKETVNFCKSLRLNVLFSYTTPLPKTSLYDQATRAGKIENLETLLEKWDIWQDDLLVNLTDMSDEELVRLKFTAEREINASVKFDIRERLITNLRRHGLTFTFKKGLYWAARRILPRIDPYSAILERAARSAQQWSGIVQLHNIKR